MSRVWRFSVAAAFVMMACPARAQSPLGALSQFKPVALDTRGDAAPLPSFILTAPLRLALQNDILPQGGGSANCASREEAAGNTVGGIPLAFHQEVALTPRLTLAGFSQLGCPIDGSLGALLAFTTPIRSSLALVLGAGIIIAPGQLPLYGNLPNAVARQVRGAPSATGATVKADLVWKTNAGRFFTVGVGSTGARHTLTFGGGF